jgi:D-glucuronyl C5-epimerase-like protein
MVGRRRLTLICVLMGALLLPAAGAEARRPSIQKTLNSLAAQGAITPEQHTQYTRDYSRARSAVRHLRGSARSNMQGVLDNIAYLAGQNTLGARVVPVFLTLERNYEWFWTDRNGPAAYGARRSFDGTRLIFEFYPGSGWQITELGNFGKLNGLAAAKRTKLSVLTAYGNELLPLAVDRGGFLAFEYYFPWSGGKPGWISGMATATGMAAFARVWKRTGDPRFLEAGQRMLGAFSLAPPTGVLLDQGSNRAYYLQYSQDPDLMVGNAFAQSIIGLDDFATITGDTNAAAARDRALAEAAVDMPVYDTGAWSLYWHRPGSKVGGESDLHYHQLFEGFLEKLCARFPTGPFCTLHDNFARYETEPVKITRLAARKQKRTLRIRYTVSKRGSGTLTLSKGGKTVASSRFTFTSGGDHLLTWTAPKKRGSYELSFDTVSLNGLKSSAVKTVNLR